jgi:predicted HD phosphohydrolase
MSQTVGFTEMKHGTREDYLLLRRLEHGYFEGTARRVLSELARQGSETIEGYKVTRLQHALQAAARAEREGADIDWIVAALIHDIGDGLAPQNHDQMAAAIVRPFLREECTWVVEHHGAFQMVYYAHHYDGWNRFERETWRDHPYYPSAVAFCERWDQNSFDPDYRTPPLAEFAPLVQQVFARKAYDPAVLQPGRVLGLPPLPAAAAA